MLLQSWKKTRRRMERGYQNCFCFCFCFNFLIFLLVLSSIDFTHGMDAVCSEYEAQNSPHVELWRTFLESGREELEVKNQTFSATNCFLLIVAYSDDVVSTLHALQWLAKIDSIRRITKEIEMGQTTYDAAMTFRMKEKETRRRRNRGLPVEEDGEVKDAGSMGVDLFFSEVVPRFQLQEYLKVSRLKERIGYDTPLSVYERNREDCWPITRESRPPNSEPLPHNALIKKMIGDMYSTLDCHWESSLYYEEAALGTEPETGNATEAFEVAILVVQQWYYAGEWEYGIWSLRHLLTSRSDHLPAKLLLEDFYRQLGLSSDRREDQEPLIDALFMVTFESLLDRAAVLRFEMGDSIGAFRSLVLNTQYLGFRPPVYLSYLLQGHMLGRWLSGVDLPHFDMQQIESLESVLEGVFFPFLNLQMTLKHFTKWSSSIEQEVRIEEETEPQTTAKNSLSPLQISSQEDSKKKEEAIIIVPEEKKEKEEEEGNVKRRRKLRIGYIGGIEFAQDGSASDLSRICVYHSQDRFQVFVYAFRNGSTTSNMGIERAYDFFPRMCREGRCHYRELSNTTVAQREETIRADRLDIIINVSTYTSYNSLKCTLNRPAPIQIAFVGWPSTTGAHWVDYFITHPTASPLAYDRFWTEKFIYLPEGPFPAPWREIYPEILEKNKTGDHWPTRADLNLPEDAIVFANFGRPLKIDFIVWRIWMFILESVPNSVLWLLDWMGAGNFKEASATYGISPDRIIITEYIPSTIRHLRQIHLADIVLDTFSYSGGVTNINSLWAGVPVISFLGKSFAQRMGASLLVALDLELALEHLVAHDVEDYRLKAVRLATNPQLLASVKNRVLELRETSPLFNVSSAIKSLEVAYETAYQMWERGLPPDHIYVDP